MTTIKLLPCSQTCLGIWVQFCRGTYSQFTFGAIFSVVVSGFEPYLGLCRSLSPVSSSAGKKLKFGIAAKNCICQNVAVASYLLWNSAAADAALDSSSLRSSANGGSGVSSNGPSSPGWLGQPRSASVSLLTTLVPYLTLLLRQR